MGILRFFRIVFLLFVTLCSITISLGIVFPLLCPIYAFRFFVSWISKYLRPDLQKILTTRSCCFAVDDLYNKPRCPLTLGLYLKGAHAINMKETQEFLTKKLVDLKINDDSGQFVRPELQHYITQWMGFYFWKAESNFKIEDHIYFYKGRSQANAYDEFAIYEIYNEITTKPFVRGKSPWEFVVLNNCKKDQNDQGEEPTTLVIFRVHHALADGFSILSLMTELIQSVGSLEPPKIQMPRMSLAKKICYALELLICGPYHMYSSFMEAWDSNEWHIPAKKLTNSIKGAMHDKIPVEYIKEIKNLYGVTFTSVILAGFAGGMRNFMLENGVKVPKKIHCIAPLPMPGHNRKMRNHMSLCFVTLPVGMADPKRRVLTIDKDLRKLKNSLLPAYLFYLIPFFGGLFPFMTKYFVTQFLVTAITSNFPGPNDEVTYLGTPIADMNFSGGMLPGNIGVGITTVSYNNFIRLAAGLDESIFPPNAPIKSLVENVAKEFDILKKEGSV